MCGRRLAREGGTIAVHLAKSPGVSALERTNEPLAELDDALGTCGVRAPQQRREAGQQLEQPPAASSRAERLVLS